MNAKNEETYLQLYKKYQPTQWKDLIGQEKTANSLRLAVLQKKIPTAFIFAGPRGTGKTSSAFLLAKTLNCENLSDKGEPCNRCSFCLNIDNGTQMGVSYLSMANIKGVDEIRDIVKKARLSQPLKHQVWILDEVHNLSKAAWDALLIPIESKDMPSLFILCTTEANKIPTTISSRIMQRKFNLVKPETMLPYVKKILEKENLTLNETSLESVVKSGRGSVRDTLTFLDTVLSIGEQETNYGVKLLEAISSKDISKVLTVIAEAADNDIDFKLFSEQLFEDLRELLLIASKVDPKLVNEPPVENINNIIKGMGGRGGINILLNEIGDSINRMNLNSDCRILMEIALIKALSNIKKALNKTS